MDVRIWLRSPTQPPPDQQKKTHGKRQHMRAVKQISFQDGPDALFDLVHFILFHLPPMNQENSVAGDQQ